jgi:hypothetical protein
LGLLSAVKNRIYEVPNINKINIRSVFALSRCEMYRVHTEQTQGKYYDLGRAANKGCAYFDAMRLVFALRP